ncbi:DUF3618 domain-containing protein [Kitasatospora sp. NPDC048194]|uniref:DUF3618 domain-containing protein n=1 Tax=Kitasatospora sp. NPDC048194 TaxID=3364045 RepID=UPI003718FAE3
MGTTPDQLRGEVEARRAHLAHNVDRLAERVTPRRVARRRMDATKRRLTSAKEQVMGSVSNTGTAVGESARDLAGQVGDSTGALTGQVGETISDTAAQVADAARHAPAQVRSQTRGNPIAAGIIAFGAGMLAGTLLPVSQAEQHAGAQLREHADDLLQPVKQAASEAVQEVREELREPAQQAVESVKATAQDAVQSTTQAGRQAAQTTAGDLKEVGQDAARQAREQAQD